MANGFFSLIIGGLSVASVLCIWFHTYFIAEYYKLLNIKGISLIDEFILVSKDGYFKSFPSFIYERGLFSENRTIRWLSSLQSCPFCLCFILSLPFLLKGIEWMGASYYISIFAYLVIKKLL